MKKSFLALVLLMMFCGTFSMQFNSYENVSFGMKQAEAYSSWARTRYRIARDARRDLYNDIRRDIRREQRRLYDLTDPNSKEYKLMSMENLLARLPYGESKVILPDDQLYVLQRVVKQSPNATIVNYLYKKEAGRAGRKCGLVIMKSNNPEDLYTTKR